MTVPADKREFRPQENQRAPFIPMKTGGAYPARAGRDRTALKQNKNCQDTREVSLTCKESKQCSL